MKLNVFDPFDHDQSHNFSFIILTTFYLKILYYTRLQLLEAPSASKLDDTRPKA